MFLGALKVSWKWRDVAWIDVTWRVVTWIDVTCFDVMWKRLLTWRQNVTLKRHDMSSQLMCCDVLTWRDVMRRDVIEHPNVTCRDVFKWRQNVFWRDVKNITSKCHDTSRHVNWSVVTCCRDVTLRDVNLCDVTWRHVTWRKLMWLDVWVDVMWCGETCRGVH
jgi:hypothetical protein